MRTLSLLVLATLLPATAFAWDSTTEDVQFEGTAKIFRGIEWSGYLPSEDSAVAIGFRADTDAVVSFDMVADSGLTWPEALTHYWEGVARGGTLNLDVTEKLAAFIKIDMTWAGMTNLEIPLWERNWNWLGTDKYDSLLLPGDANEATVNIDAEELAGLDYTFDVTEDVQVTIGGDLYPTATAIMSGAQVTTNDMVIIEREGDALISLPSAHNGKMEMESVWQGDVYGTFGIEVVPWINICIDGFGCIYLDPFHYDWEISNDAAVIGSEPVQYLHALPALGVGNSIDLGTLYVGESTEVELDITNLGAIELEGTATYTGDAVFNLLDASFYAGPNQHSEIVISFAPDAEGSFNGTLTFASNDPVLPEVQVPIRGNGVLEPIDEVDDDDVVGDEGELGAVRGCACNTTPAGAPLGV
ncbi:MAG: hypothetical protein JRI25_19710, partial [Deltaproteobacteria bacterium]|nr:hypothetical protein [Deltaproteobacteria bacterium]